MFYPPSCDSPVEHGVVHVCNWVDTNTQLHLGSQNHLMILCQLSYHKPRKLVEDLFKSYSFQVLWLSLAKIFIFSYLCE